MQDHTFRLYIILLSDKSLSICQNHGVLPLGRECESYADARNRELSHSCVLVSFAMWYATKTTYLPRIKWCTALRIRCITEYSRNANDVFLRRDICKVHRRVLFIVKKTECRMKHINYNVYQKKTYFYQCFQKTSRVLLCEIRYKNSESSLNIKSDANW